MSSVHPPIGHIVREEKNTALEKKVTHDGALQELLSLQIPPAKRVTFYPVKFVALLGRGKRAPTHRA